MPWVESASASFHARHEASQAKEAAHLLESLEVTRERLTEYFPRPAPEITVVLHRTAVSLMLARPQVGLTWATTAPAARRYVAGCAARQELHVLSAQALQARASSVPGSREMLALSAHALYVKQLVLANNGDLQRTSRLTRPAIMLRWAWLLEGAARWFSGQTEHARPAIARRMREGSQPSFPPSLRDAPLLGGTVIDLIIQEQGEPAAAQLAGRLHSGGPKVALTKAFGGRALIHSEGAWRNHLARLAGGLT